MSLRHVVSAKLPTRWGDFQMHGFENPDSGEEHIALSLGDVSGTGPVLVRVHSECLTGDVLGSLRCDCGEQLHAAMQRIAEQGCGALLYLRQEGRGIGLINKVKAYQLQDQGADTVEANEQLGFGADLRDYSMCAAMFEHLGISRIRLMTNNPRKLRGLADDAAVEVVERVPLQCAHNPHNARYLGTKAGKLGHLLGE